MPSRFRSILSGSAEEVAPRLLGCMLIRDLDGQRVAGRIVETEAYDQRDTASHSYRGRTPRTDVMFGPSGYLYVYFTYGMHFCMNVVVGPKGYGSAVLIRAIEPTEGTSIMSAHRRGAKDNNLTNGPAKVCQAFAIDKTFNGHDLEESPLWLQINDALPGTEIVKTTRIGISRDQHRKWRYYIKGNDFISKR